MKKRKLWGGRFLKPTEKVVEEFLIYAKTKNFIPVLLWMPQKDDLLVIRKKKNTYYQMFINNIQKKLNVVDLTEDLINRNDLDDIFSDDTEYGGHYSRTGNKLVAEILYRELKEKKII